MLVNAGILKPDAAGIHSSINVDNKGSIDLANGESVTKRSKHIEVRYHMLRDLVKKNEIALSYIPINENAADSLTKPLAKTRFVEFRDMIGL